MKIIEPYYVIETPLDGEKILKNIERVARTCYKSEDRITEDSASKLVSMLISKGHTAMLEHESISVRFVCDRGISHELVRHRIASFAQESSRYCDYSKDKFGKELTFIKPPFFNDECHNCKLEIDCKDCGNEKEGDKWYYWYESMKQSEENYFSLLNAGATPQEARSVLPNSLKTEIVVTMNLRSWINFFELRTSKAAHPQIRQLSIPLLLDFKRNIPVVFDRIEVKL